MAQYPTSFYTFNFLIRWNKSLRSRILETMWRTALMIASFTKEAICKMEPSKIIINMYEKTKGHRTVILIKNSLMLMSVQFFGSDVYCIKEYAYWCQTFYLGITMIIIPTNIARLHCFTSGFCYIFLDLWGW